MGKGLDLDAWIAKVRPARGHPRRAWRPRPPLALPGFFFNGAPSQICRPGIPSRTRLTPPRAPSPIPDPFADRSRDHTHVPHAQIKQCEPLEESELESLCGYVKELLVEESNVQPVSSPVTVCGDIHGQFHDLLKLLETGGDVPDTNYIFMGDFVDRGYNSLESFTLLLLLKARHPQCVTLLRGNHESRQITQVYGFYDECQRKYGNANAWRWCTDVFDYLTLSAVIDGKVLCVHGGLSPDIRTLDQVRTIDRLCEIPHEGPFCDMMWSDPEDLETWAVSPRGAGWLFGRRVTQEFNEINGLELICRAHQLVQEGLKYMFPEKSLVTVWSAPNYCYRCGNVASILAFDDKMERTVKYFTETPENSTMMAPRSTVPYFL